MKEKNEKKAKAKWVIILARQGKTTCFQSLSMSNWFRWDVIGSP